MNQLCKVCAEPAAGFHFGAFTCEGCKSFFGRTYNNLSQINECKNGSQCIINKQNRTSCKACRLRKCLVVGMSKSGSRYGRRSNWFKIHCLLQEQCGPFNNSTSPLTFRSPVTPTLQDGSLPFVNSQLREAFHTMEGGEVGGGVVPPTVRIPPIGSPGGTSLPSCSVGAGGVGGPRPGGDNQIHMTPPNFTIEQLGAVERRLHEEALSVLRRSGSATLPPSELEATYRDQLFEVLRRSHGLPPPIHFDVSPLDTSSLCPRRALDVSSLDAMRRSATDSEQIRLMGVKFERVRRASADAENRLTSISSIDWDRRLREAPCSIEPDSVKQSSPHDRSKISIEGTDRERECTTICEQTKLECERNDGEVIRKINKDEQNQGRTSANRSPTCVSPKPRVDIARIDEESINETPMTEEERLSFLKSTSTISTNNIITRDNPIIHAFPNIQNVVSHRSSSRNDLLYSPINNNVFPFPSYPPVWPSILPFPSLAKFYSPFNTASLPGSPVSFDGFKSPIFLHPELRNTILCSPSSDVPKEDSTSKKRILDAILQVQRENAGGHISPPRRMSPPPTSVSVCLSLPQHVVSSSGVISSASTTATIVSTLLDQPIDLTVRRKRKMAKRDIMFKPGEETREEDMESEDERDEGEEKHGKEQVNIRDTITRGILFKGTSEIVDIKTNLDCSTSLTQTNFEVPMKIMKLESSGDTLLA